MKKRILALALAAIMLMATLHRMFVKLSGSTPAVSTASAAGIGQRAPRLPAEPDNSPITITVIEPRKLLKYVH